MKIAPLKVSDPWFGRIKAAKETRDVTIVSMPDVPIEMTVDMELVELLHGGPEQNYRPYLHLRGEITAAKPTVELPYGVDELVLRPGSGLRFDAFYDFNSRQLGELVGQGYFLEGFRVPDGISGIAWELPGAANFEVVAPEFADQAPVVFMDVRNQRDMELDESNSGHDLADYFDKVEEPEANAQATIEQHAAAPRSADRVNDVFADVAFDELEATDDRAHRRVATEDARSAVPSGVFSRLVDEITSRQAPVPEPEWEPEQEQVSELTALAEEAYRSRVDPGVERVLAGDTPEDEAAAEETPAVVVDQAAESPELEQEEPAFEFSLAEEVGADPLTGELVAEPELGPRPLGQRRAAEIRTARIRAELEDAEPGTEEETEPSL